VFSQEVSISMTTQIHWMNCRIAFRTLKKSDNYEADRRWQRPYDDVVSETDKQYVVFKTHRGRHGKCSNDVQRGDEIWTFVGSTNIFVLRRTGGDTEMGKPNQERGGSRFLEESAVKDHCSMKSRYILVGACAFLGQVANTWSTPNRPAQCIEIV
jgi:hypothetical protein